MRGLHIFFNQCPHTAIPTTPSPKPSTRRYTHVAVEEPVPAVPPRVGPDANGPRVKVPVLGEALLLLGLCTHRCGCGNGLGIRIELNRTITHQSINPTHQQPKHNHHLPSGCLGLLNRPCRRACRLPRPPGSMSPGTALIVVVVLRSDDAGRGGASRDGAATNPLAGCRSTQGRRSRRPRPKRAAGAAARRVRIISPPSCS